jgi:hypothetical protein
MRNASVGNGRRTPHAVKRPLQPPFSAFTSIVDPLPVRRRKRAGSAASSSASPQATTVALIPPRRPRLRQRTDDARDETPARNRRKRSSAGSARGKSTGTFTACRDENGSGQAGSAEKAIASVQSRASAPRPDVSFAGVLTAVLQRRENGEMRAAARLRVVRLRESPRTATADIQKWTQPAANVGVSRRWHCDRHGERPLASEHTRHELGPIIRVQKQAATP